MSKEPSMSLVRRWPVAMVFSLAVLAFAGRSRADDDLDRFKAENQVKAQKLTGEVSAALTQARDLERSDPARARQILRRVLVQLEDASALPERQRESLEQQVRNRINQLTPLIRAKEETDAGAAAGKVRAEQRPAAAQQSKGAGTYDTVKDRLDAAKKRKE